ncbi:MAG: T9SS type A sorting domain-containing protein [Bacteroidia bacterium]|nr:T9SS type A sorting domain-containing protein [Bacteroidia bacterium]
MKSSVIFTLALLLSFGFTQAQQHASPTNMALGVPGPAARSFVIAWHPAPGAVAYEYILTDNFLCFAGCAGDTRQRMSTDTTAIEYELLIDKQYYWVTRVHFANGEIGPWSLISEFWSYTPDLMPILQVAPNPVEEDFRVLLDWGANEDVDFLRVRMISLDGQLVYGPVMIRPETAFSRMETLVWEEVDLPPGQYFLQVEAESNSGLKFQNMVSKILIRE